MLPHDWPCSPPHSNALRSQTLKRVAAEVFQKWVSVIFANTGTGYFLFDKFRFLFSESLRCDFGCTRARLVPADLLALNHRRRPHGAFHCTPGTEAIGTDGFWRASLVCRRSRREGRAFFQSRRSHGALHCAPETEALCSGVHRSSTAS